MMICVSGFTQTPNKRHNDFYSVGDIGYVEFFFNSDGQSIGNAACFVRTDDKFVPFQSTNDFDRRLEWDKAKFDLMKQWLNRHLPRVNDLGAVEVTNTPPDAIPSHRGNRVDFGGGKIGLIQIQPLTYSSEYLKLMPQAVTNDYFSLNMYLDSTNTDGFLENLGAWVSPNSIVFRVDGKFYRLTIKHKMQ